MFYKMIQKKRDLWYQSPDCTVRGLVDYMEKKGRLRDAQIDAIRTYLFLKIGCNCRPLYELVSKGAFNTLDIGELALPDSTKTILRANPAAAALYEYVAQSDEGENAILKKLKSQIGDENLTNQLSSFFREVFYHVSYPDYLFSLPMGAGKTWLMAAFIYLDLYFAMNEPNNPIFAHNFLIFAPSGLKSSVVPSLRTIQNFDPTWVIPEPAASEIKRQISFEVLDQSKTGSKSNRTKNPNVQKIASHQPISELFGLVAVTNAEKVILDRIQLEGQQACFYEDSEDDKDRIANELRNLLGKLPRLSVFIDEVHHAVSDEIKLRAVINRWAEQDNLNSVLGFSGTPYLEKVERVELTGTLKIANDEISNIVYYYPLVEGVGNFLKQPVVKIEDQADSLRIIENGVRTFLDNYRDKVYADGTSAKLGIYCGTIEKLEQQVYPLVSTIAAEYGIGREAVLKFHRGNKSFPQPADSQLQFELLDKPFSKIRIILLVQIGKEGWDCRSLTGIILSQEGDCDKKMVLQTSCRCLRQVTRGEPETALIYLNAGNAAILNDQLQKQHRTTLKDFSETHTNTHILKRYDRTAYLKLPKMEFYQLRVNYETLVIEPANPEKRIPEAAKGTRKQAEIVRTTDFSMQTATTEVIDEETGNTETTFLSWLNRVARGGINTLSVEELLQYEAGLRPIYNEITFEKNNARYYSSQICQDTVNANIRKAFCDRRVYRTREEVLPETVSLLNIANFTSEVQTTDPKAYYPNQQMTENIVKDDEGKLLIDPKKKQILELAEETEDYALANLLRKQMSSHPQKDRSFHYLPYRTDSTFEITFLEQVLTLPEIEKLNLEVYYNGDRAMTEFRIRCYRAKGDTWQYIGIYTPDFLIIRRKNGKIHQCVIVETKGEGFTENFREKRKFMEEQFLKKNNQAFGYQRFDFLYLEDTLTDNERILLASQKIKNFFGEEE